MTQQNAGMQDKMKRCGSGCRWCPLMPVLFGSAMLLAGYYLDAETVRILWLIFSGAIIVMGLLCFIMMRLLPRPRP